MKQKNVWLGLLLAILGFGAMYLQRRLFLQEISGGQIGLWIALGVMALLIGGLAWIQGERDTYETCFSSDGIWLVPSLLAAAAVLAGSGWMIYKGQDVGISYFGVVAAIAIGVTAVSRFRGDVPSLVVHGLPTFYLVVKLIFDFRSWSIDPFLMDYCFALFASIAAMVATCHMGFFVVSKGRRRTTLFWCLLGASLAGAVVADGQLVTTLTTGGMALWLLANGGQLLED